MIKTDQKTSKSFSSKTTFVFFILFAVFALMTFDKTIESFTKALKIMHFNNARVITVNDMQRIINVILYK